MAKKLVEPEYEVYKVDEVNLVLERDFYIVGSPMITSSSSAVNIFRQFWKENLINVQEQLSVMLLNQSNKVIGMYQHSSGAISSTVMDNELIAAVAVKSLAKGVIVAHNHPSGNLMPSDADIKASKALKAALQLFNINLLDSLIIVEDSERYTSLLDEGKMEFGGIMASGGVASTLEYDYYNPYDEYYYPYGEVYNEGKSEWVITKKGKTPEEDLGYWENYKNTIESDLSPTTGRYAGHYWVLLGDDENPIGYWHKLEAGGYMAKGGDILDNSKQKTLEELDKRKNELLKKADVLISKKKKLYSNVDIESPMSVDEKNLNKDINDLLSEANQIVMDKRKIIKGGYVVINKGGDRYDGGLFYQIEKDGKVVKEGMIDGEAMVDFNGKKYDGLKSLAEGINAELKIEQMKYGGYMAKGGDTDKGMKPLSYYKYENASITIIWKGKTQPYGRFNSAEDALDVIKDISKTKSEENEYQIRTPNGLLNVSDYNGGYMAKGGDTSDSKVRFDIYGYKNVNNRVQDGDEIIRVDSYKEAEGKAEKYLKDNGYKLVELYRKDDFVGSIRDGKDFVYSSRYKKEDFKSGGYMAKGGITQKLNDRHLSNPKNKDKKHFDRNNYYVEVGDDVVFYGSTRFGDVTYYGEILDFSEGKHKYGIAKIKIEKVLDNNGNPDELSKYKKEISVKVHDLRLDEDKMAMGGVTFKEKVKSIKSSLLERKKVSPSVQKDYGKTYSPKEATESALRIAGAMRAKEKINAKLGKKKK